LPGDVSNLGHVKGAMEDDEHRVAPRHRVLKGGHILFGGGSIDCTVRNLSETGAALEVTTPLGIPSEFLLETDGVQRPCRVVWRKEKRIGITFDKE
jgi:PilZ domain